MYANMQKRKGANEASPQSKSEAFPSDEKEWIDSCLQNNCNHQDDRMSQTCRLSPKASVAEVVPVLGVTTHGGKATHWPFLIFLISFPFHLHKALRRDILKLPPVARGYS